jgi:hypothetical protein
MSELGFSSSAAAHTSAPDSTSTAPQGAKPNAAFASKTAEAPTSLRRPASLLGGAKGGAGGGATGQGSGGQGNQQQGQGGQKDGDEEVVEIFEMPRPVQRVNKNLFEGHGVDLKRMLGKTDAQIPSKK